MNKKVIITSIIVLIVIGIVLFLLNNRTYKITFNTDGGNEIETQIVKRNTVALRPEDPVKKSYEFIDWYINEEVFDFNTPITKDIILTAKWKTTIKTEVKEKYVVRFNSNLGSIIPIQTIEKGKMIEKPKDPTRSGYIFKGWILNNKPYNFDEPIEKDIELIATWEKEEESKSQQVSKKYTVKFNSNGGSTVSNQIILEGKKVQEPKKPTKSNYNFIGWYTDSQCTKKYDFNTKVYKDIKLYAKWGKIQAKYKVTFDTKGGTPVPPIQTINSGEKASKPTIPTRNGYIFKGWTLNGNIYNFNSVVKGNITLVATWEKEEEPRPPKPPVKKYTVKFNSNGGSTVSNQIVSEGKKVQEPKKPTKSNYNFIGWYIDSQCTEKYNFTKPVTENLTLYAKWEEKEKYEVTFDTKEGTPVPPIQTINSGEKASKPTTIPTRNGYIFKGWTLNGNDYNFNSPVTENITLVAKWVQKTYTIKISPIDDFSPSRLLTVYEDGNEITVKEIKLIDGFHLCSGGKPQANVKILEQETNFIVVLNDGTEVIATKEER